LLTLPFAGLPFATAFLACKSVNIVALALAWNLAWLSFGRLTRLSVLAGGLVGLWAPLWQGLDFGQPVGLIALGMMVVWMVARGPDEKEPGGPGPSGRNSFFSGLLVGMLCTLRPYFFILTAAAMNRSPRNLRCAVAGAVAGAGLMFAVVGITPWSWWLYHASGSSPYANIVGTLGGVLHLGSLGGIILYLLSWLILSWFRRKSLGVDVTMALAMGAILWTYPLAWYHYDVLMVPACVWIGLESHRRDERWPTFALMLYLISRAYPSVQEHFYELMYLQFAGRTVLMMGLLKLAARR
jgi:Glycosyltransferase family 87